MKKPTVETIEREILKMDPTLEYGSKELDAAVVLFSSAVVGPDPTALIEFTRRPTKLVREIGWRLKKSGIWRDGKVDAAAWFKKDGAISFWLDVSVALGLLNREKKR